MNGPLKNASTLVAREGLQTPFQLPFSCHLFFFCCNASTVGGISIHIFDFRIIAAAVTCAVVWCSPMSSPTRQRNEEKFSFSRQFSEYHLCSKFVSQEIILQFFFVKSIQAIVIYSSIIYKNAFITDVEHVSEVSYSSNLSSCFICVVCAQLYSYHNLTKYSLLGRYL